MTAETRARAADVVERLRSLDHCDCAGTNEEAAAEIKRLRAALREIVALQDIADVDVRPSSKWFAMGYNEAREVISDIARAALERAP